MADLAGFDVIAEVHIDTIVDLLNLVPVTNPIDGKRIHILGGPFSTDLNLDLGPLGIATLRIIIDCHLRPVVKQSEVTLTINLNGGTSIIAGRSLRNIGGQATVTIPVGFALPPTAAGAPEEQTPNFVFSGREPHVALNAATQVQIDTIFGPGAANNVSHALEQALADLLAEVGTRFIPVARFQIVPGRNSDRPDQLSALPTLAWITDTALGVFGYYRAVASGGNILSKLQSDIEPGLSDFFFHGDNIITPGRRVALLISAEGFRLVAACPTVRNGVIRGLLSTRELPKWQAFVTARDGNDGKAQAELNDWLDPDPNKPPPPNGPETISGREMIEANVPPPCGTNTPLLTAFPADTIESLIQPLLHSFEIKLEQGKVAARFNAGGNVDIGGALGLVSVVEYSVDGEVDLTLFIKNGVIVSDVEVKQPNLQVSATGIVGLVLALEKMFEAGDGPWNGLMSFGAAMIRSKLKDAIGKVIPETFPLPIPQDTIQSQMVGVDVTPDSVMAIGLVSRVDAWNDFNPSLFLNATLRERTPTGIPEPGQLNLPATAWGCPASFYSYTRTFWDETYNVRAIARDVPLPVTLFNWRMELGNWTGGGHTIGDFFDPRPTWSGDSALITAANITLQGKVEHLVNFTPPELRGRLSQANVTVEVSGDANNGWTIRILGQDGNFFVKFSVEAQDGSGRPWTAETFITHRGEELELPSAYEVDRAACDQKFADWFADRAGNIHGMHRLGPGDTVMNLELREGIAIRQLNDAGNLTALSQIQSAVKEFGSGFLEKMNKIPL